jgi:kinesin family protein 18/19
MIDLAGNEKTCQNESKRFIEGININKSLLTLGKCINLLSENNKNNFIPFRDSKLTRILKESLGGNSKTVMIACISS